jgi:AraC-like DNA-binding protein
MLTARITSTDKLKALSHGADAYLTKPFEKAELFTRIDQLILLRKKLISKLENNGFFSFLKEKVQDPQTKFIQLLVQAVNQRMDDSDFGSLHLSQEVNLSESQLYRKIKAITGKSTAIFIRSVRLQHAKQLLQTTDKNVSEIAYETGFNHPSWFSKAFKEEFGHSPSDINV